MLYSLANRERTDARKINADIKLSGSIVFDRMWIDAVCLQAPCNRYKFIIDSHNVLSGLALSVQLHNLLFQLGVLSEGEFEI